MKALLEVSRIIDRITGGIGKLVGWLTLAMVLASAFNALARWVDARQTFGVQLSSNAFIDTQWYLFSLVFLLGASHALLTDSHVRVDVLSSRMSRRTRAWLDVGGIVLFLLPFSALLIWLSWPAIESSWRVREQSPDPGGLPRYPIKLVIPIGFGLLIVQALSELIKRVAFATGVTADPHRAAVAAPDADADAGKAVSP
jgi:TRAP-type mannitol/chloroaromatic compound transport system permease small subunit